MILGLVFFVIAIIAAVFGFGGIAGAATFIAQIIFSFFSFSWHAMGMMIRPVYSARA
jgi:uncharacterized membrane protein YtjA (UPF0391 family)